MGQGTTLLGQLIARDVKATPSGDGSITLAATHIPEASVPGSAMILDSGNPPHVTTTVGGNGTITPGNHVHRYY